MLPLPRTTHPLFGTWSVPADKSMSHRALLLAALAQTPSTVANLLDAADVRATGDALRALGTTLAPCGRSGLLQVTPRPWAKPAGPIDCANAGTLMRLLCGALVATGTPATLVGDASLNQRPMGKLCEALGQLGARVERGAAGRPPLHVLRPNQPLTATRVVLPVASAQLATAVMLAALGATGTLSLSPIHHARDHTLRGLQAMGATLRCHDADGGTVTMAAGQTLQGVHIDVPGDPSSAAFWLAAAAILPGSQVSIDGVGLNPTRTGFFRLLRRMGAQLEETITASPADEPRGRAMLCARPLVGIDVGPDEAADAIDELVLVAAVASFAHGVTTVRGAQQLRTKESDRIEAIVANLSAMGARIEEFPDGFRVHGPTQLHKARLDAYGDHRIAMALAVAALGASGPCELAGAGAAGVSYPTFFSEWRQRIERAGT